MFTHCRKIRKQNIEKIKSENKKKIREKNKNHLQSIIYRLYCPPLYCFLIETTHFFKICVLLFFSLAPPLQLKLFTNVILRHYTPPCA